MTAAKKPRPKHLAERLRLPCRHCRVKPSNRPRQLCWHCYYENGGATRNRYEPTSKHARRGVRDFNGRAAPPTATDAVPGSPEKVAELVRRAARGEALFAAGDRQCPLAEPVPNAGHKGDGKPPRRPPRVLREARVTVGRVGNAYMSDFLRQKGGL